MILTAHQPCYLPWLGLFHKIALADTFVCYDHVLYSQGDFTAKNCIKTAQGRHWLIVPVVGGKRVKQTLNELKIDNASDWRGNHWKTICTAYGRAPYFNRYADYLENFYRKEWEDLTEMTLTMLQWLLATLGIPRPLERSSRLDIHGAKSEGVLDMCRKFKAEMIILGEQGPNYIDQELFDKARVRIMVQNYEHPKYKQMHGTFVSHLSVLDLLFNCGEKSLDILMSGNKSRADLQTMVG